jgi:transposase
LVLDVVGRLDLSRIERAFARGGVGREAYDPAMLTALLLYGYCVGERSSRGIERACVVDVAFRVVAGQQRPDHTTLARFRAKHAKELADLFSQVLVLCARAGMVRVGTVSIDGSKIAGAASARKNYTKEYLRRLAGRVVEEAGEVDAAEDALYGRESTGDELPAGLAPGADRGRRIQEALARIEEEEQRRTSEDAAAVERKLRAAERRETRERETAERKRETPSGRETRPVG